MGSDTTNSVTVGSKTIDEIEQVTCEMYIINLFLLYVIGSK